MNNTVCILAAGTGSRMGEYTDIINKALLPYKKKAIISHIIDKFGKDSKFVIAVGYKQRQVIDYITIAHPQLNVTFVEIEDFTSSASGPAKSLLNCKDHLMGGFFFISCDTLFDEFDPNTCSRENWIGVSSTTLVDNYKYCNVKVENGKVVDIKDKEYSSGYLSFIGLMYIRDAYVYFENLIQTRGREISQGFGENLPLNVIPFDTWKDFGTYDLYKNNLKEVGDFDFLKKNEFFYNVGDKIIKFHKDKFLSYNKYIRTLFNKKVFPPDFSYSGNFHYYTKLMGHTLYEGNSGSMFVNFLKWLEDDVWFDVVEDNFKKKCQDFYYTKTLKRIDMFYDKYLSFSDFENVNGVHVSPLQKYIGNINWDWICDGLPSFIHGDLQFDNVIVLPDGKFKLIDWRHKFADSYFGDKYYDLSKMYGGMILNYNVLSKNMIPYTCKERDLTVPLETLRQNNTFFNIFESFCQTNNYDLKKIELIVPVIYANMSPLHTYPFDQILYGLAQYYFQQWYNKYEII